MDKEKLRNKIDRQLIVYTDGIIEHAEEITSELNALIGTVQYVSYLQFLKDKIFEKED